jgi:hypothetical protein
MVRCPMCQYYLYKNGIEKTDHLTPFVNAHWCTNPHNAKDGQPVPLDTMETYWLIDSVKHQAVGKTKWNRSPQTGYMTLNRGDSPHEFKIWEPDQDEPLVIPAKGRLSEVPWKIVELLKERGIEDVTTASPDMLEGVAKEAREWALEERVYIQKKVNYEQWRSLQMWDHGCEWGCVAGSQFDKTKLENLTVKVNVVKAPAKELNIKFV